MDLKNLRWEASTFHNNDVDCVRVLRGGRLSYYVLRLFFMLLHSNLYLRCCDCDFLLFMLSLWSRLWETLLMLAEYQPPAIHWWAFSLLLWSRDICCLGVLEALVVNSNWILCSYGLLCSVWLFLSISLLKFLLYWIFLKRVLFSTKKGFSIVMMSIL